MSTFGQSTITTVGRTPQVSADGQPEVKQVGVTIDWATVAAVTGADVVLEDGTTVKIGEKYLRYGQVITQITTGGKFGPYDDGAGDGREALDPGETFVLNRTVKENDGKSDHAGVAIYGGPVFKARLIATAGTHSLAAGPTYTELLAALPRLQFVINA